ncbi:MAG: phosphotransferase [Chloroflexota bacterium]|nr:phosphotransferase [Chloroflexota bacterium]MDQ5867376.1 phosphotransferase [Chloroflexota bacterium]
MVLPQKGELIGEGRTAQVYAWGPGHVLKLYYDWWPEGNIEYEARTGRAVHMAGIPSPAVGEIVVVDGRRGLVYERIDGPSMTDLLLAGPGRVEELAHTFAQLHATMHRPAPGSGLPSQRDNLLRNIDTMPATLLPATLKEKVLRTIQGLPGGDAICHGDYHPGNVIMSSRGPVPIDWENASLGSPAADVARSALLLETAHFYLAGAPEYTALVEGINRFRQLYLQAYCSLTGADPDLIDAWRVPMSAHRLHEGIAQEEAYLLDIVAHGASTDL